MLRLRVVILFAATTVSLAGCGRDRETAEAASNSQIGIQTNQMFVTIENHAGTPLLDVSVAINAPGAPPYTHRINRLESSEKIDISLAEFSSRDGTTFNLRMITPRSVHVTGTDLTNKKYDAETRWKS